MGVWLVTEEELAVDFLEACAKGDTAVLQAIFDGTPQSETGRFQVLNDLIAAPDKAKRPYGLFFAALEKEQLQTIHQLLKYSKPKHTTAMIEAYGQETFRLAIKHGDLAVIRMIFNHTSAAQVSDMIATAHDGVLRDLLRSAATHGDVEVVRVIFQHTSSAQIASLIAADNYGAFREAVGCGHAAVVLALLESATPPQRSAMIARNRYSAFRVAAEHGHSPVMLALWQKATRDQISAMIESDNYSAFRNAAIWGHASVVSALLQKATPDQRPAMIAADNYGAFRKAAIWDHLDIMQAILKHTKPEQVDSMIEADNYAAFRWAAWDVRWKTVQTIWERATPVQISAMLDAAWQQAPAKVALMLSADNYRPLFWLVVHGYLSVIQAIVERSTPAQVSAMMTNIKKNDGSRDVRVVKTLISALQPRVVPVAESPKSPPEPVHHGSPLDAAGLSATAPTEQSDKSHKPS